MGDDDQTCTNLSEGWGIGDVQCYRASQDACTSLPYRMASGGNMGDALFDVDQTYTKLSDGRMSMSEIGWGRNTLLSGSVLEGGYVYVQTSKSSLEAGAREAGYDIDDSAWHFIGRRR